VANQITDNRTSLDTAESATPYDDLAGVADGTLDNEIFIQGSNSIGLFSTNSLTGLLFDNGTVNTAFASKVFYIWINCGIVGLLESKANGGFRIRFAGATVTDFFEVYVGGNDDWPTAVSGGWVQFAIDIEEAHTNSDNTGGSKPATNAIRYIGFASLCTVMPRMADNTWIDEIAYLANDGSVPGIIIEGRNGGSTDWDSADIATELGVAVGTFVQAPGGAWKVNTPVQFGVNDSVTHAFTDTNAIWLWDDQEFLADSFYGLSALGNSGGTTDVTFGVKTGTGDDATGAQGFTISAATLGVRWDMDFNDPDLDGIEFFGCSFIHGGAFLLDDAAVSAISTLYIDCDSALVSNSEQLRISVIDANTADAVAFMTTDDLGDIVFSSFLFSDGHGVELTTPRVATQASKGNLFIGYGITTSNDAAIFNDTAGAVQIDVTDNGTVMTFRDGTSASTTVSATASYTINNVEDPSEVTILDRDVSQLDITGTPSNQNMGDVAANERVGQSFEVTAAGKAERIRLNLRKVGTPTDFFRIRLVNGIPGSSELLVSTFINGADLTTSYVEFDIDLDGKSSLSTSTTYGIEIERSGAVDGSNYYQVEFDTSSVHADGVRYTYNGSWNSTTGDLLFSVMEAASDNELYHVESVTTGTTVWNHDGTSRTIEVLVMATFFLQVVYLDTVSAADKSNSIVQIPDRVFSNP